MGLARVRVGLEVTAKSWKCKKFVFDPIGDIWTALSISGLTSRIPPICTLGFTLICGFTKTNIDTTLLEKDWCLCTLEITWKLEEKKPLRRRIGNRTVIVQRTVKSEEKETVDSQTYMKCDTDNDCKKLCQEEAWQYRERISKFRKWVVVDRERVSVPYWYGREYHPGDPWR